MKEGWEYQSSIKSIIISLKKKSELIAFKVKQREPMQSSWIRSQMGSLHVQHMVSSSEYMPFTHRQARALEMESDGASVVSSAHGIDTSFNHVWTGLQKWWLDNVSVFTSA